MTQGLQALRTWQGHRSGAQAQQRVRAAQHRQPLLIITECQWTVRIREVYYLTASAALAK